MLFHVVIVLFLVITPFVVTLLFFSMLFIIAAVPVFAYLIHFLSLFLYSSVTVGACAMAECVQCHDLNRSSINAYLCH